MNEWMKVVDLLTHFSVWGLLMGWEDDNSVSWKLLMQGPQDTLLE